MGFMKLYLKWFIIVIIIVNVKVKFEHFYTNKYRIIKALRILIIPCTYNLFSFKY